MTDAPRLAGEGVLTARVRELDPAALLDALAYLGYRRERIHFRGHFVAAPQPTLLHAITFTGGPTPAERNVTVTVNLGLLSCRSPLPSYLVRLLEERIADETDGAGGALLDLVRALDAGLIAARLRSLYPERDTHLLPEPWTVRHDVLRLGSLRSPVTLDWLFRTIYPELGVRIRRVGAARQLPAEGARLGTHRLAQAVLGEEARVMVQGLEVLLAACEPQHDDGTPWAALARQRLDQEIFPLLGETGLTLRVILLLGRGHAARFDEESYLGFDPLQHEQGPHRVILFAGQVPEATSV